METQVVCLVTELPGCQEPAALFSEVQQAGISAHFRQGGFDPVAVHKQLRIRPQATRRQARGNSKSNATREPRDRADAGKA